MGRNCDCHPLGTYGVVFRARDKGTKEILALKKVKMDLEKEGFPITALREIKLLLQQHHPNIVNVREVVVGSDLNKIFVVMEYVQYDMRSFMDRMRRHQTAFVAAEVKCLMQQLLRGLDHLHQNWILHRDLKVRSRSTCFICLY